MKKNPPKEKLALEEYIVGGSALPKSLIEGFEKILESRSSSLGMTETSPLGTASRLQPKHTIYQKTKIRHSCQTRYCFSGVEIRIMTDEGL
jgi:fatty-acyl-CoA synthase